MANALDERIKAVQEENEVLTLMVTGLRQQRRSLAREVEHLGAEVAALRSMLPQRPATAAVLEMLMQASSENQSALAAA